MLGIALPKKRIENTAMKKLIYTLLTLAFFTVSSQAQRVLSLEECIEIALANNLDIKRARNNAVAAESNMFQSKMNWLPSLNAGANHRWNEGLDFDVTAGRLVNTTTLGGGGSVSANMTVFDGFSNMLNAKRSQYLYDAAQANIESNIQSIEVRVVAGFLDVISTRESLKIAEQTKGLLQDQLDREEKRERAGVGNMEQVYNFRSQVAQQDLNIVNVRNRLETSQLTLIQLLPLDPTEDITFGGVTSTDAELELEIDTYASVFDKAMSYSPGVKSAEFSLKASNQALKAAKNYWMPTVSVSASYGTGWSSNRINVLERDSNTGEILRTEVLDLTEQFKDNVSKSATMSLSIPIFNRFRNSNQVQQSKIQMLNSELGLEQAKNTLTNSVQQAYLNLVNAKTSYAAAKESLLNLNTAYEFAKNRYENGTIDFVTYLQSLNGKNNGELQLARAKYSILFRQFILDIFTGELEMNNPN